MIFKYISSLPDLKNHYLPETQKVVLHFSEKNRICSHHLIKYSHNLNGFVKTKVYIILRT